MSALNPFAGEQRGAAAASSSVAAFATANHASAGVDVQDNNLPSMSIFRDPLQDDNAVRKHASHRKVFLQDLAHSNATFGGSDPSNRSSTAGSRDDPNSPPLISAFGGTTGPAIAVGAKKNNDRDQRGGADNDGGGGAEEGRIYEADEIDRVPPPIEGGCLRRFFHELLRHGGIGSSVFNFTAGTVGAGFLALPQAFALCGYLQGTVLLVVFGLLTVYSVRLLGMAERRTGLCSFEDLSRHLLGGWWDRFTTFVMISFNWGTCVAYVIALIKVFSPILESADISQDEVGKTFAGYWGARLVTIAVWAVFMVPMALQKELNSLRHASLFSIVAITYFIFVIVGHAVADGKAAATVVRDLDPWLMTNEMLTGISLIMFAFCCQSNVYEVFGEMQPRSVKALTASSGYSVGLSGFLYLLSGWFGYLDFGRVVHGAVLDDYHPKRNPAIMIAFVCLCVKLCTSFLLCIHPTRDSVLYTLNWGSYMTCEPKKRMFVTFILCVLALICGLFIPDITLVFGLLGGLGGSTLGFLFPAMYCLFTGEWTPSAVGWFDVIGVWVYLFLACLTCSFGVVASVYSIMNGDS